MSDVGSYSGLYDQIRDLGCLLDIVLVDLKSGTTTDHSARQRLSDMLLQIASASPEGFHLKRLKVVLREPRVSDESVWKSIAEQLQQARPETSVVAHLESMAEFVEMERAKALASMRGRSR